jgi:hypothetical protein
MNRSEERTAARSAFVGAAGTGEADIVGVAKL